MAEEQRTSSVAASAGVDHLARALAQPLGRRRALAVFGGTLAALMLPTSRRGLAWGQTAETVCSPANEYCRAVTCPDSLICCLGPPDYSTVSQCPTNPHCCDPCDPSGSKCLDNGDCGPGPIDNEMCCKRQGGVPCGRGGCCPQATGARQTMQCGSEKALCCVITEPGVFHSSGATKGRAAVARGSEAPFYTNDCGMADAVCEKPSWDEYLADVGACARAYRNDPKSAPRVSNAYYYQPCFAKARRKNTKRLLQCPRIPDPNKCGKSGECWAPTKVCCEYQGLPNATARAASAEPPAGEPPVAGAAARRRVTAAELRRRIEEAEPRMRASYRKLVAAQRLSGNSAAERAEVIKACERHRDDVLRLRRRLAAGRGARPQRLLLRTYDEVAEALLAYANAMAIANRPEALAVFSECEARWARANRLEARAHRALR